MSVLQCLPMNEALIIIIWILSMIFRIFKARGLRCIPKFFMMGLTEFFHADTETKYLLSVSLYFTSIYLGYHLCFCTHMMSILCSAANAVNSCNRFFEFNVITLNVTILGCLHLSNCGLHLSSEIEFLNTKARASTSTECTCCLTASEAMWFGRNFSITELALFLWLFVAHH